MGRAGKAMSHKPAKQAVGESDGGVVPTKASNKGLQGPAEGLEGRPPIKENIGQSDPSRTQSRGIGSRGLHGVREAAKKDQGQQFNALLHHVTPGLLRDSFYMLKREVCGGRSATDVPTATSMAAKRPRQRPYLWRPAAS